MLLTDWLATHVPAQVLDGASLLTLRKIENVATINRAPKAARAAELFEENKKLKQKIDVKGLTLVPLRVYFGERGYAKVTLAICKGKNTHDKRATLKDREAKKELRDA